MAGAILALVTAAVLPLAAQSRGLIIKGLTFSGNKHIPSEVLAASIGSTNSDWTTRAPLLRNLDIGEERYFDQRQFLSDVIALEVLFRSSGFPDVVIDTVLERREGEIHIEFRITEGEPIRIVARSVGGALDVDKRYRIVRDLPLAAGDIFDRWAARATADTLTSRLKARGYPLAVTTFTWDTLDRYRVNLSFRMEPGPYARFGPVTVLGSQRVDSAHIASLLTFRTGQPWRDDELYRSQFALGATRLFSYASVTLDSASYPGSDSSVVPVLVRVQEGRMFATQASAGWASTDCFRLGAGWTGRNLFGNRSLDLTGQLAKIGVGDPLDAGVCRGLKRDDPIGSAKVNYSLEAAIRQNAFLSPDNNLTLSVFRQRSSEYKIYNRKETGGAASITRETWSRIPVTLSYRVSFGRTHADPATFCGYFNSCTATDIAQLQRSRTLAMASIRTSRTRVNNPLDPSRGSSWSTELNVASRYLGSSSDQQFVRLTGDIAGYFPISRQSVLATHLRAGVIVAPKVSLEGGSENFIPPDQRLYAGGPNDVRGYQRNQLGPVVYVVPNEDVDFSTDPPTARYQRLRYNAIGGDRVISFSAELRTPSPILPKLLRLGAFVDMGALSARNATSAPLRITPGAGVRMIIPRFPPIRFDVAWNPYGSPPGALYTTSSADGGDLVLLRENFRGTSTSRFTFHLAFGQAW